MISAHQAIEPSSATTRPLCVSPVPVIPLLRSCVSAP